METRQYLAALLLVVLVISPAIVYPAKSLSIHNDSEPFDLNLNMGISENVARNLTKTHSYLITIANIIEAEKKLDSDSPTRDFEKAVEAAEAEQSPVAIPAILYASSSDSSKVIEYLYRYMMLTGHYDNETEEIVLGVSWENNETVRYDPSNPSENIFGGYFEHDIIVSLNVGDPEVDIDEGAGDPDEIVDLFQEHVHYSIHILKLEPDDSGTIQAKMENITDADSVKVRDYSLFSSIVVQPTYDKELIEALNNSADEGGYVYYALAKVSFKVDLSGGSRVNIVSFTTYDEPVVEHDITSYVRSALNTIRGFVNSADINATVKDNILEKIDEWYNRQYTVETSHFLTQVNITWWFYDEVREYRNESLTDSYTREFSNNTARYDIMDVDEDAILETVVDQANEELSQYYPTGINEFRYTSQGVYPFLLNNTLSSGYTELQLGASSPALPVTDTGLLVTAYPVNATGPSGPEKLTEIEKHISTQETDDYSLNYDHLVYTESYSVSYQDGDTSVVESHNVHLEIKIEPKVVAVTAGVDAIVKSIDVEVNVNPVIKAKKVQVQAEGETRLTPALAPLGGTGIITMIEGGVGAFGFDNIARFFNNFGDLISSNKLSWLIPTYFPLPLPEESLKVYAPGEYIGAYYMTQKVSVDAGLLSAIGTGVFSIMYEEVNFRIKNVNNQNVEDDPTIGVIYMSNGSIDKIENDKDTIRMYTFGIGVGDISGRAVGERFYSLPSGTGLTTDTPPEILQKIANDGIIKLLTGEGTVSKLLRKILPSWLTERITDIARQVGNNGIYPQFTPYFSGGNAIWPYMMVTAKSTDRFVVTAPGNYNFSASSAFYMLHIRVFKIPILGIPVPVPVFVSHKEHAHTTIYVREIGVLPLVVSYNIQGPESLGNTFSRPTGSSGMYGKNSSISIYAVPVWMSLDGSKPLYPVLLRGNYGMDENSTSLTIVATDSKGEVISGVDVYFFGVPLTYIKIPLAKLDRIIEGEQGEIYLQPAWKHGMTVHTVNTGFQKTVITVSRMKTFNLFFYDGKMITYTGVYDPDNKIHEFAVSLEQKANEVADTVRNKLEEINSSLNGIIDQMDSINELIDASVSLRDTIKDLIDEVVDKIKQEIINYAVSILQELVKRLVIDLVKSVVAALIPDPTGVLVDAILKVVGNVIDNITSNIVKSDGLNIVDILKEYATKATTVIVLQIAINFIGEDGMKHIIETVKDVAQQGIKLIKRINNGIEFLLAVINNTVEMSKYKPVLLSYLQVYNLQGNPVPAESVLARYIGDRADNISLPIDAINGTFNNGAILVTRPFSALTFLYQLITGEKAGNNSNIEASIPDILSYIAVWANLLASLTDNTFLENLYNTLTDWGDNIGQVIYNVEQWIELPGLDTHSILIPGTTLVPPNKI